MAKTTTAQARVSRAERMARAVELSSAGLTYRQIASAMGVSVAYAHKLVQEALRQIADEQYGDRRALLGRELRLLDRLSQAHLSAALQGDPKAAAVVLRCHEARVRITGLATPVQVEARVQSQMDAEIASLIEQLDEAARG